MKKFEIIREEHIGNKVYLCLYVYSMCLCIYVCIGDKRGICIGKKSRFIRKVFLRKDCLELGV